MRLGVNFGVAVCGGGHRERKQLERARKEAQMRAETWVALQVGAGTERLNAPFRGGHQQLPMQAMRSMLCVGIVSARSAAT